jgi:hypothetical protein
MIIFTDTSSSNYLEINTLKVHVTFLTKKKKTFESHE